LQGTAALASATEESITDGVEYQEVILFTSDSQSVTSYADLARKELAYTYSISDGLIELTGTVYVIG